MLERLGLPLSLTDSVCEGCGAALDAQGRHRGACIRSGRVKIRAGALERAMASVCREAGGLVRSNVKVADLIPSVPARDERRIDVLAQNLPSRPLPVAVDTTVRSALTCVGSPVAGAAREDGAAAGDARAAKEAKYPELAVGARCELVVFAMETGGRWSAEAVDFVHRLAAARADSVPVRLRFAAAQAFERRWARWLSTASAVAFVRLLVLPKAAIGGAPFAPAPELHDLLAAGSDGGTLCPTARAPTASDCLALAASCPLPCCGCAVPGCQDAQTEVFSAGPGGRASMAPFRVVSPLPSVSLSAPSAPPGPP